MTPVDDLSRSLVALDRDGTVAAVIRVERVKLVGCLDVPGVARRPLKK